MRKNINKDTRVKNLRAEQKLAFTKMARIFPSIEQRIDILKKRDFLRTLANSINARSLREGKNIVAATMFSTMWDAVKVTRGEYCLFLTEKTTFSVAWRIVNQQSQ